MDTTIVQPQQFSRDAAKQQVDVKIAKGNETMHAFQWLIFNPQKHAIEPFETNASCRNINTVRNTK